MKKLLFILFTITFSSVSGQNIKIPDFLDKAEIENFDCNCLEKEVNYTKQEQKYVDILWEESLQYLKAYAIALTTSTGNCVDSDQAIYETVDGHKKLCVMDEKDMRLMVKHIYLVLLNQDKAKKCFAARKDLDWLYSPGGKARENSIVDQWLDRMTLEEFFKQKVADPEVRQAGVSFANNFNKMITGDDIELPSNFPYDISANALPNLWSAVGWVPMYAEESERNVRNFKKTRGGYAYGEIFGHWGLLRIDEINGEKVGAEIGMVVQAVNTFYAYHNHAISEMYHTIRKPACVNQFKTFAIDEDNPAVNTVYEDKSLRRIQFDTNVPQEYMMWSTGAADNQPFVYFHRNTIHAFEVDGNCEAKPEEKALVTIWARSNAADRRNDYGTTLLCESADNPGTPGKRGEVIQCDLTKIKW
ncbi:Hypothetical protein I595_1800 [Croceitalea dokdonensis DOKDO 023]|uniref:Uncharacterized protein n=1 Tax=Croceitalea dokdonensis DOKDO 023 TaxID=1300341 RepID=A0A0P7AFP1_9FLAO|nr:hypothetical protein [Croceitalea dokdonensis]KPM32151.1 Hypothetical protein I595_1800 [Croceitalea dokdonensis DOKDO 023]